MNCCYCCLLFCSWLEKWRLSYLANQKIGVCWHVTKIQVICDTIVMQEIKFSFAPITNFEFCFIYLNGRIYVQRVPN